MAGLLMIAAASCKAICRRPGETETDSLMSPSLRAVGVEIPAYRKAGGAYSHGEDSHAA